MNKKVITRFAPSPTGLLHAGNYRTALFAYIYTLQNKGEFILRIEDSDQARSKKEYEENIIESLEWLGIKYNKFFRQSDRTEIHKSYIKKLIDSGHAFISKEKPEKESDREEVIRFKNPNKKIVFDDLIRGEIEFDTTEQGDFVIARSMDEPVFHLAVVVDDSEMGVTLIIRGEDHISNTPRHILIYEALGLPVPLYAHLPLLLSPDRSKLSKRKGALPITAYRDKGYLKEALINYMAFLGWNPGTEQEIMSLNEIISQFKLGKVQKSGAIFSEEKLDWFNKQYIGKMNMKEFEDHAKVFIPENISSKLLPLIKEKINKFSEISELINGELSFIKPLSEYPKELLKWKQEKDLVNTKEYLKLIIKKLSVLSDFSKESVKSAVWPLAEEKGKGNILWPMRVALSGKEKSPDPFIISEILGKEETIKRLTYANKNI
ncbi:MAG: glutamate--tRNA ligase [Patescibacteria group bacterium]